MSEGRVLSRPSRRTVLVAGTALLTTGCFGSFNLSRIVYDWNAGFGSRWVRWLVFLVFVVLPVYAVTLLVDALVLNSIEFWSGEEPARTRAVGDDETVTALKTDDPEITRIEHRKKGELISVMYIQRRGEDEVRLLDPERRLVACARCGPDGDLRLFDARGKELARLGRAEQARVAEAATAGLSPAAALDDELLLSGASGRVAALRREVAGRMAL